MKDLQVKFFSKRSFDKFISGFPKFLDVLIGQKPCWKGVAAVIKLFWKPMSKT
jgi:hypothetical protein